jgi:hypothetical protein
MLSKPTFLWAIDKCCKGRSETKGGYGFVSEIPFCTCRPLNTGNCIDPYLVFSSLNTFKLGVLTIEGECVTLQR